ncbi:MAG: IS66 family insertion sequence element accessory protein TnpB, partial [Oscillospiraceae bacterium]|nr:IS66 family insertion sequence element accessory protein TnpB [Oscillospiraceae bacterium]
GYLSRMRYGTAENAGRASAPMLNDFTGADKVYIACGYTDLRKGIDGLARLVQQQFELDPFTNTLFLFCGRRRDRIKGLCWEKNGFILLYKRLEQGAYQWPRSESEVKVLTPQQYRWLMEGLQIEQPKAHRPVTGLTTV